MADKIIYLFGWIFFPLWPILLLFTVFSRIEPNSWLVVHRHTPLLEGKSWEEIRRRNFYLSSEILTFIALLILFFTLITHLKNFSEKFRLILIIADILILFFPTIFLFKFFEKYGKKFSERTILQRKYTPKSADKVIYPL